MTCSRCSAELPAGSLFCHRCGARQDGGDPAAEPFSAPNPGATAPEETLWKGSYAWRAAAHLWLLAGLWVAALLVVYLRFPDLRTPRNDLIALGAALLPAVLVLGRTLLRKLTLRYRLTNHRLFTERGLLSRQHDELELIRVDDISVRQNVLQRLFDVGTVTLLSTDASNPKLSIEGIGSPLALKESIRTHVRARRARTTFLENI